ncbi:MAG: hypothetical protein AB8H86_34075 [Polyangiales bacterium]
MSSIDLHADSQAPHDFVTSAGTFARTLERLEDAKSKGLSVEVRTWLTRATFRHLQGMPRILKQADVRTWHLHTVPWGNEPVPRLAMAWPHALRAAKEAEAAGITVLAHGAPRCVLGPYARLAAKEEALAFGEKCRGCAAQAQCAGVDEGYLARFGDEDLRALA